MDDLPMQTLHQRGIFCLRVTDDNIVIRDKKSVANLTLSTERLAGTGCAQNQAVGIFQFFAVNHDKVV